MDNLKSILYVLPATAIGGAENRFLSIIRNMTGLRSVVLTHAPVAGYFVESGMEISIYNFEDYGCKAPMPPTIRGAIRYAAAIADIVKLEKIDCMLGIMHVGCFYVSLAKDIHLLKAANIGTILGNLSAFFFSEQREPSLVEKALLWYLLRRPALLIVSSDGVKGDLASNFGIREKKIKVIRNGIDISRIKSMAEESAADILDGFSGKTIVTACRLNKQKDFLTLLKAFAEIREQIMARLVIVGEGELRELIVSYAEDLGIGNDIIITGFQKNPFRLMKAADVFVLSSFFEGFGNVIVEAMAVGTPVVATDCPSGPAEIIQDGINGLLTQIMDHHSLAEAVLKVLGNRDLKEMLISNGVKRAEDFRVETMTDEFRELFLYSTK
jgi:glycosyltransferase involved in cell wall biosynthesis